MASRSHAARCSAMPAGAGWPWPRMRGATEQPLAFGRPRTLVFLLPGSGHLPVGGFKVAYEYAQHLSIRGFRTSVVHAAWSGGDASLAHRTKALIGYARRRI